ncbi:jacalin-related lectin 3 isoform X1 [Phoenix dactylifera]|uniref:Jacalin-related lectin 3 isoform X1 n=2 Tax=Phoenix dactylifera TaxID=42345 RepID=A0A8B9B3N2_PHODC|nr:jacalin-related lectin 3 isoform X1 [Phoenix dactylifera]
MSFSNGNEKSPILVGPWGGEGGSPWDDGVYTTIRQVVVVHGAAIDSIRIEYDKKGSSVWSEKHGGNGGTKTDKVKLDHPHEILTSVSGYFGSLSSGSPLIRSLTFESNQAKYGPFGFEQGMRFSFPMSGGKIVGFHGRSGWYLDSIGFYLKQLRSSNPSKALVPSQSLTPNWNGRYGYNAVDGTISKGYDIVLAVRERGDDYMILSNNYTREGSLTQGFRDVELKNRAVSFPSYTAERGSSFPGGPISYGPWGGSGGTIFDDGIHTGVRQINISRNAGITSIKVLYDKNGRSVWGNKHGGSGGIRTDKIVFDFPFEILTYITGYFGTAMFMGPTAIKSLTFHTTKRKYGPFGDEQGMFFSSGLADAMVVGFHGRSGWYIDSIGVHVLEGKVSLPQNAASDSKTGNDMEISELNNPRWSNKLAPATRGIGEEVTYGVTKEPVPIGPGPWGGDGGKPWDDGVYSGIKQLYITWGEVINSIQIEYDRSGQSVWSTRHGGSGETTHRIKFDYPHEVLNCVSGYYATINRDERPTVIKSLTFCTTRGKYGPFGEEVGTHFTSATTKGKVVGFHGRSALYLDAIGVHMQHWLGEKSSATKSLLSKYFF